MTDFNAEAREAAKLIPDPPAKPCADVLRFPATQSERLEMQGRRWMRKWTRPMPPPTSPGGLVA